MRNAHWFGYGGYFNNREPRAGAKLIKLVPFTAFENRVVRLMPLNDARGTNSAVIKSLLEAGEVISAFYQF